jgi:2-methylcitrate synthase
MQMMLRVKDPKLAAQFLDGEFAAKRKVMGFGHRVYKEFDPRARLSRKYLDELARRKGSPEARRLYELCVALEETMWAKKRIPPNLDFYAAPIFHILGIRVPLYTPVFAASRAFGWMAHYSEQLEDNALIRPDATYVGPRGLEFVPLDER